MLKRDVIEFYGTKAAAARAIGVTRGAVTFWGDVVPARVAIKFAQASKGRLKVDPKFYAGQQKRSANHA